MKVNHTFPNAYYSILRKPSSQKILVTSIPFPRAKKLILHLIPASEVN